MRSARHRLQRSIFRDRRADRIERRSGGSVERLLYLPRAPRPGRWRVLAKARRGRSRLSRTPVDRLRQRAAPTPADELDSQPAECPRPNPSRSLLFRHGFRADKRLESWPGIGALFAGRPGARHRRLRELPRRGRRRRGAGEPAACRPADSLSGRAARGMAPLEAPQRPRRRHASDQSAPDSFGKRGARGLCVAASGSGWSGISGSIPRSTS